MDAHSQSSAMIRMIDEDDTDDGSFSENVHRQVALHENNVSWRSVTNSNEKCGRNSSPHQSTSVNRSNKIAPFLGGFVNPLANVTTPLRKANISPSNYHTGYECDSSSSESTNSLHESLFPKTASWRMMSISGRRPSNVKILSMDHSGSWRVLSQKGSKKRQLPSFPIMVSTPLCHLVTIFFFLSSSLTLSHSHHRRYVSQHNDNTFHCCLLMCVSCFSSRPLLLLLFSTYATSCSLSR